MWVTTVKWFIFVLSVLFLLPDECSSLKDVRIVVPTAVKRGDSATLKCQYDIESDLLYSVKWYRNDKEFFRFTPKENPVIKVFANSGFTVSKKNSSASTVQLDNVELSAAGRYMCEVSADYPSFFTSVVSGSMDVVEAPAHRPVITGVKPRYKVSNLLRGNCTSKHSRPAANLTWYINGHQAQASYTKRYKTTELTNSDGLQTAVLGISFVITQQHFETGKLKIRCTASMYSVYWQSTEKSIEEEKVKSGSGSGRSDGIGVINVPPESQHVALMYPVHGTALDSDPPPIYKNPSHAYGGANRIEFNKLIPTILLIIIRTLFEAFSRHSHTIFR